MKLSYLIPFCVLSFTCVAEDSSDVIFYDDEHLGGGTASVVNSTSNAFSSHVNNLRDVVRIRRFNIGDDFFENPWVGKTASTELRDGLGPLFNNNACQDCHVRDGRGHSPADAGRKKENDFSVMIVKATKTNISASNRNKMLAGILGSVGDSRVGVQLQQNAIFDIKKEASLAVRYAHHTIFFDDGFAVELRTPHWIFNNHYPEGGRDESQGFDADTLFSPRIAPPMIGLGLLALIDENTILDNHDPEDKNSDKISGKANRVWSVKDQKPVLGRFGWKAGQPTLRQQAAGAFNNDMGLTTAIFPHEGCLKHQRDCIESPNGNGDSRTNYPFEVSLKTLDAIEFYAQHLAVPVRRNSDDADVKAGKKLFMSAQCQACHRERFVTKSNGDFPELSEQVIYPYTDLLLHDMGDKLADIDIKNRSGGRYALVEYQATAHEWRTPPLWGLGLTKTVNPEGTFLHDGRARTILEAILWHGGEAQASVDKVLSFNQKQRAQLLRFLNDL